MAGKSVLIGGLVLMSLLVLGGCKEKGPQEAAANPGEQAVEPIKQVVEQVVEVVPAVELAPDFVLNDQDGNAVRLSELRGKVVVLEWTNFDCPFVGRHYKAGTMKGLADKYADDAVWLAVNSTNYMGIEDNKQWVETHKLDYQVLDDHDGKVGRLFAARTTPHMFVIDRKGAVVYDGAVDNDPGGRQGADEYVNYVDKAVGELVAGGKVTVSESRPYGCSVKYAQ